MEPDMKEVQEYCDNHEQESFLLMNFADMMEAAKKINMLPFIEKKKQKPVVDAQGKEVPREGSLE